MPLYNKERDVRRSIESVLNQTIADFELIVVNDGSTDGSLDAIQDFRDERVRIISQRNQGVSAARNRGIAEAKSNLIAFIDADDEWMPDFLETILRLRDRFPTCMVFATSYVFYESMGRLSPTVIRGIPQPPWEGVLTDYFYVAANSDPPLCSSAVAVNKEAILSIGGFPVGIVSGEDLLTWARLAAKFDIAYSTRPCAKFKVVLSKRVKPRIPQVPDMVGAGLLKLIKEGNEGRLRGIENYLSMWHRMRASCFLQLGEHRKAMREAKRMLRFSKRGFQWGIYGLAACLPPYTLGKLLRFAILFRKWRRDSFTSPARST